MRRKLPRPTSRLLSLLKTWIFFSGGLTKENGATGMWRQVWRHGFEMKPHLANKLFNRFSLVEILRMKATEFCHHLPLRFLPLEQCSDKNNNVATRLIPHERSVHQVSIPSKTQEGESNLADISSINMGKARQADKISHWSEIEVVDNLIEQWNR